MRLFLKVLEQVKSILGIYNNLSLNKIHAFLIHYWARGIGV